MRYARSKAKKSADNRRLIFLCRDDKIRTCGLFVPNEARYRAALHPETFALQKYYFF